MTSDRFEAVTRKEWDCVLDHKTGLVAAFINFEGARRAAIHLNDTPARNTWFRWTPDPQGDKP